MRTIQELATEALQVQDACNLSGVVHAFSRALTDLRAIARADGWEGTVAINNHPIAVLYADKIATLTASNFGHAYAWATDTAGTK